jgi:hypothetical protein
VSSTDSFLPYSSYPQTLFSSLFLPSLPPSQTERGQKILLLETGEDEHLNPLTRWGYFFPSGAYSHLYHNYFTEPEPHVNNRRLYHQAAKALGGGTAVNAMGRLKEGKEGRREGGRADVGKGVSGMHG